MISLLINIVQTDEDTTEVHFHTADGRLQTSSEKEYAEQTCKLVSGFVNSCKLPVCQKEGSA